MRKFVVESVSRLHTLAIIALAISFASPTLFAQGTTKGTAKETTKSGQPAPSASVDFHVAVDRFYEKPFNVLSYLKQWEREGGKERTTLLGFLAGLFAKYPDRIKPIIDARPGPKAQIMVVQGLRFADMREQALAAAKKWNWPEAMVAKITPAQPLRGSKVSTADGFDVMWSASFATGDAAYVRPIFDAYVAAASRPDIEVTDLVLMAKARSHSDRTVLKTLREKYPREKFVLLVHAASALWSLESNARKHAFVAQALDRFAAERPAHPAVRALQKWRRQR